MLKEYMVNGMTFQFEDADVPAGAVPVEKEKPATKTKDRKPKLDKSADAEATDAGESTDAEVE